MGTTDYKVTKKSSNFCHQIGMVETLNHTAEKRAIPYPHWDDKMDNELFHQRRKETLQIQ